MHKIITTSGPHFVLYRKSVYKHFYGAVYFCERQAQYREIPIGTEGLPRDGGIYFPEQDVFIPFDELPLIALK